MTQQHLDRARGERDAALERVAELEAENEKFREYLHDASTELLGITVDGQQLAFDVSLAEAIRMLAGGS